MKQEQPTTSALYRFCCGGAALILWCIGFVNLLEACDGFQGNKFNDWLLLVASIATLILAYRIYRPVRTGARRKKEAEAAGWIKIYHDHPELPEANACEARMQNLAKAIADELKEP